MPRHAPPVMEEGGFNCIVVLGPTAVGKTSIGVRLALRFQGEVVSADSRQTYRGLDIGSGKDLCEYTVGGVSVPHHLIDVADVADEYTVFDYQRDFYRAFAGILSRNAVPIVVGGTGLYLDSVLRGYNFVCAPENPTLRFRLASLDLDALRRILLELRPDFHTRSNLKDRERTIRAIEIAEAEKCGAKPQVQNPPRPCVRPLVIGTTLPRIIVRENIAARLRERLDGGMVEEVAKLHESGVPWERLERFGLEYRFCSLFLEGKIASKEELFERLNIAIRQFAKRQETWFRGMEAKGVKINWLSPVPDKDARADEALSLAGRFFT